MERYESDRLTPADMVPHILTLISQMHVWMAEAVDDIVMWERIRTIYHRTPVTSVAFSPLGNRLVCTSDSVDVYDTEDWSSQLSLLAKGGTFNTAVFDTSGAHMAVGGNGPLAKVRTFYMSEHIPRSLITIANLLDMLPDLWPGINMVTHPLVLRLKVLLPRIV